VLNPSIGAKGGGGGGEGGVRIHRVNTGSNPESTKFFERETGKNNTSWHNVVILCNSGSTKGRAGYQ